MVTQASAVVTLITGGASGIGRATALRLAARGDHVALVDRDEQGLAVTAQLVRDGGGYAELSAVDVCDGPAVRRVVDAIAQRLGPPTYLFSNAGVTSRSPVADMPLSEWRRVLDTHVTGAFHFAQAVLPYMVSARRGGLVLMSSDYAIIGMRGGAHYAAAKTALYSLAKALAVEFAASGIRVNAVGPGPIDTPHLRRGRGDQEWRAARAEFERQLPIGRLGQAAEVAAVVDFLLSERAAYVTGQLIQPNGGQVMW